MDVNASKKIHRADQVAKTAHDTIERMHERVASMEDRLGSRMEEGGEHLVAQFERRARALNSYIEANPVKAAMVAFGIGMFASRMFRSMDWVSPGTDPGTRASPGRTPPEPMVSKAA